MFEQAERFYRELVGTVATGLLVLDRSGTIRYSNRAAERILDRDCNGVPFAALFANRPRCEAFVADIARRRLDEEAMPFADDIEINDGTVRRLEIQAVNALGAPDVDGIVLSIVDATAQFRREQQLIANVTVDALTGLPNRNAFLERARSIQRGGGTACVALADLDFFKQLNDQFGHAMGDAVLQAVARRLAGSIACPASVARVGGDEFVVLLPGVSTGQAERILLESLAQVARPIVVDGVSITVSLSAGIASTAGDSPDEVLRNCDMAMYAAKARGRNRVVVFGSDVRTVLDGRRELSAALMRLSSENKDLRSEARTDSLTGLRNRRALDDLEGRTLGGDDFPATRAAVLFVDIDHFGRYNHRYGDSAGDTALQTVAQALVNEARATDLVFRKGGEEFVVLLPDTDATSALRIAERMRHAIELLAVAHADSPVSNVLTVTIGVAWGDAGQSLRQMLIDAGDEAMRAKVHGCRNAVHPKAAG